MTNINLENEIYNSYIKCVPSCYSLYNKIHDTILEYIKDIDILSRNHDNKIICMLNIQINKLRMLSIEVNMIKHNIRNILNNSKNDQIYLIKNLFNKQYEIIGQVIKMIEDLNIILSFCKNNTSIKQKLEIDYKYLNEYHFNI